MSNSNEIDIDKLLSKWSETKVEISELEKKIEKYKRIAAKIMNKKNTNTLFSNQYKLERKNMNNSKIYKKDLPPEILNKFSKNVSYEAFYLRKNK